MNGGGATYSFHGFCEAVGKSPLYVKSLLRQLDLPLLANGQRYSAGYVQFLRRVVALRSFSVSIEKILEILETEKKILRMLHFDSLGHSDIWYLAYASAELNGRCLVLTGVDVGFSLASRQVQVTLDFGVKDRELFTGSEMGEDIRRVLDLYLERVGAVLAKVQQETPVLEDALTWGRRWQEARITGEDGVGAANRQPTEDGTPAEAG